MKKLSMWNDRVCCCHVTWAMWFLAALYLFYSLFPVAYLLFGMAAAPEHAGVPWWAWMLGLVIFGSLLLCVVLLMVGLATRRAFFMLPHLAVWTTVAGIQAVLAVLHIGVLVLIAVGLIHTGIGVLVHLIHLVLTLIFFALYFPLVVFLLSVEWSCFYYLLNYPHLQLPMLAPPPPPPPPPTQVAFALPPPGPAAPDSSSSSSSD